MCRHILKRLIMSLYCNICTSSEYLQCATFKSIKLLRQETTAYKAVQFNNFFMTCPGIFGSSTFRWDPHWPLCDPDFHPLTFDDLMVWLCFAIKSCSLGNGWYGALQFITVYKCVQNVHNNDTVMHLVDWQIYNDTVLSQDSTAAELWHRYEALTASLAQDLCEQLRLVLEPSQATKLK